jgi:pimeloyl-ACP methyl ester carboxylesterase
VSATLVLLPGLGADPRLFGPQKRAFPDLISMEWPQAAEGQTLASYAERVASRLPRSDSLVLGGSSFGGMVALEIAARVPVRGVVLIGSCRSPRAFASWIRGSRPLIAALPSPFFRPRRWALPLSDPFIVFGGAANRALAWDMVRDMTPRFLKWGSTRYSPGIPLRSPSPCTRCTAPPTGSSPFAGSRPIWSCREPVTS